MTVEYITTNIVYGPEAANESDETYLLADNSRHPSPFRTLLAKVAFVDVFAVAFSALPDLSEIVVMEVLFAGATPDPSGSDPSSHNAQVVDAIFELYPASTKYPCPVVPVNARVVDCVDPTTGAVIFT